MKRNIFVFLSSKQYDVVFSFFINLKFSNFHTEINAWVAFITIFSSFSFQLGESHRTFRHGRIFNFGKEDTHHDISLSLVCITLFHRGSPRAKEY